MDKYAFPLNLEEQGYNEGLTIRDYFASAAVQGLLVQPGELAKRYITAVGVDTPGLARLAYDIADAMLDEREK